MKEMMGLLQPFRRLVLLVSLFLGMTAAADVQSSACDDGWIFYNDMCYLIRDDYEVFSGALTVCQLFGGEIAYATDQKSLDFLSKQANKATSYGRWYGAKANWDEAPLIFDPATEYFRTSDDKKIPLPKVQMFPSPSTSCVGVVHDDENNLLKSFLADVPCDTQLPYVCRGDPKKVTEPPADKKRNDSQWVVGDDDIVWFSSRSDRRSYTDAGAACKSKGMTLLSIRGSVQMEKIGKELGNRQDNHVDPWWTALQVKNGVFSWSNGIYMDPSIVKWNEQLKRSRHYHQYCRVLRRDGTADERSCYKTKAPYMCMRPHRLSGRFGCPHKWIRAGKSCYSSATSVNSGMLRYTDAERLCSKADSHIISLDSNIEKVWLMQSKFFAGYTTVFWTSLNDRNKPGVFTWADGSAPKGSVVTWQGSQLSHSGDCFALTPKTKMLTKYPCNSFMLPGCQYQSEGTCVSNKWKYFRGQCYYDLTGKTSWKLSGPKDTMLFDCYKDTVKYDNKLVVHPLKVDSKDVMDMYIKMIGSQMIWTGLKESSKGVYTWDDGTEADISMFNTASYVGTDNSTSKCGVMESTGYFEPKSCSTCYCGYAICEKELDSGNSAASSMTALVVSTVFSMLVFCRRFVF